MYCTSVFLYVSQTFDKVWHAVLFDKIKEILALFSYFLLKSYLDNSALKYIDTEVSDYCPIKSGVSQRPILYTSDITITKNTIIDTFADGTVIMSTKEDPENAL